MANIHYDACPCCSAPLPAETTDLPEARYAPLYVCPRCDAIYGVLTLGASYAVVKPRWYERLDPPARTRYFDFTTLGSEGIGRRHGFYDPETRLITQTG
jgi:hypothetical protein